MADNVNRASLHIYILNTAAVEVEEQLLSFTHLRSAHAGLTILLLTRLKLILLLLTRPRLTMLGDAALPCFHPGAISEFPAHAVSDHCHNKRRKDHNPKDNIAVFLTHPDSFLL